MFYDLFKQLCDSKGVSASRACLDMGLSRSLAAKWKNTAATPSAEVIAKIANYFDVSTDFLLGKEQKEKPAAPKDNELIDNLPITRVARNGKKMPVDQQQKLLELAKFMFPEYFNDENTKV